jgi:hypothetical protein
MVKQTLKFVCNCVLTTEFLIKKNFWKKIIIIFKLFVKKKKKLSSSSTLLFVPYMYFAV